MRSLRAWSVVVSVVALTALAPSFARAQSSGTSSSSSSSSTPSTGTPWGTRMEHWLASGIALTLGAATVAVGTGMSRYAIDQNHLALDPGTTQAAAASSAGTARDFMLVAEVLWSVGAAIAGIGLAWVIVLSFSTPTPPTPAAATAPSAALRLTPLGISLEGRF